MRTTITELIALRQAAARLGVKALQKNVSQQAGGYLSPFRGRGIDFDEVRVYQPGDDIRHMDWRVTARAGRPYIKLFREERERPIFIVLDLGASMRFGTKVAFKSVVATRVAALLAWAAAAAGDRVGGLVFAGDAHHEIKPRAQKTGVLRLLHHAVALHDEIPPPTTERNTFSDQINRVARSVRPGTLIVWISDFSQLDTASEHQLIRLGRHHDQLLVQLFDPLEASAPPPAQYAISDGTQISTWDTRDPQSRAQFQTLFAQRQAHLERIGRACAHAHIPIRTDDDIVSALAKGLQRRARSHTRNGTRNGARHDTGNGSSRA